MKKKLLAAAAVVLITVIIASVVIKEDINRNPLIEIDTADIEEITIHNPVKYYTITEPEDIKTLFDVLQSFKLSKKSDTEKDGFAYIINVKLKSNNTLNMNVLSHDIKIDNQNYKPAINYCNDLYVLFITLSKKYQNNPA